MADDGHGATLTFGTSSYSASIRSIEWGGISRDAIDTSHLGTTTGKTFIPSDLHDPGELTFRWLFDPDVPPPYSAVAETITVTFPVPTGKSTGATYAATGFMTSFSMGPVESSTEMEATATIKFSGDITQNDSAV